MVVLFYLYTDRSKTMVLVLFFPVGLCGCYTSRQHTYIILTPLKPHFYIVKLEFTGLYIIFLISAQNIDCGYSLEPPCRGGSNEYPQSMF